MGSFRTSYRDSRPTLTEKLTGFIQSEWLYCEVSQREIDNFLFRRKLVAMHDRCPCLVVNIDSRA